MNCILELCPCFVQVFLRLNAGNNFILFFGGVVFRFNVCDLGSREAQLRKAPFLWRFEKKQGRLTLSCFLEIVLCFLEPYTLKTHKPRANDLRTMKLSSSLCTVHVCTAWLKPSTNENQPFCLTYTNQCLSSRFVIFPLVCKHIAITSKKTRKISNKPCFSE